MLGCHRFMIENAPMVQTTASVSVRPSHAGDSQGTTSALAFGAVDAASAENAAACRVNIASVTEPGRFPANSGLSIQRIWPVKNSEQRRVSHSPLPNLSARQSKCPRIATPSSTRMQPAQVTAPGLRRLRRASHIGMKIAENWVRKDDVDASVN